jgi:hypothetical protein
MSVYTLMACVDNVQLGIVKHEGPPSLSKMVIPSEQLATYAVGISSWHRCYDHGAQQTLLLVTYDH